MSLVLPKPKPKIFHIDTETTGLGIWQEDMPYACSILWGDPKDPQVKYFEWRVDPFTRLCVPNPDDIHEINQIADSCKTKVLHNSKFDMQMLNKVGVTFSGRIEDTLFAARICDTREKSYRLKYLARRHFGYPEEDMEDLKRIVMRLRIKARKLDYNLAESVEADYWICQHVDALMPELPETERERIKAAVGIYCIGDTMRTALLWSKYSGDLDGDQCFRQKYEEELELLRGPVLDMETRGVWVSQKSAQDQLNYCELKSLRHLKTLQSMAREKGFEAFNPGSPKQLSSLLYSEAGFGLRSVRQSKEGADSTDWKALRPYEDHPFVRELVGYRSSDKAIETFFGKYLNLMRPDPEFGGHAVHPSYNQLGTVTARFSCNNPNLQQASDPSTSKQASDILARTPFGPRKGYVWYCFDFAQMELRCFADVAQVSGMLDAIHAGEDLVSTIVNTAFGGRNNPAALEAAAHSLELGNDVPSSQVLKDLWWEMGWDASKALHGVRSTGALETAHAWLERFDFNIVEAEQSIGKKNLRTKGKTVIYLKLYGGGAEAAADTLYLSKEESERFLTQLERPYPEMGQYSRFLTRYAREHGFIVTKFGRKLRVDPEFAYQSVNYMIQGTCADLMKNGMRKSYKFLKELGIDAHIILTIHDELIFEFRKKHAYKWVLRELRSIMSDHEGTLSIPMPVEVQKVTKTWDKKEKVCLD